MRILVLHDEVSPDARPDEMDTLIQAQAVQQGLQEVGHETLRYGMTLDLQAACDTLRRVRPDVVFNLVEGLGGTGRLSHIAPALLDHLSLRYTGCSTEALFVTTHKLMAKRRLIEAGLPTPLFRSMCPAEPISPFRPGKYIIKSAWEHASIGLRDDPVIDFDNPEALDDELRRRAPRLGGDAYAELYIDGREFNLAILDGPGGPTVLPPAEIHFVDYAPGKPRIVGYEAKWEEDSFEYHHTPRSFDFPPSDAALLDELRRLALRCWELFRLRGYARVDFRVADQGTPFVLEVNANPCITPEAGFHSAALRAGLDYPSMLERILNAVR